MVLKINKLIATDTESVQPKSERWSVLLAVALSVISVSLLRWLDTFQMRQHHHRQGQQSKPGERIGGGKLSSHHYHYYWNKRFTLPPPYLIPDQRRGRIDCSSIIGIIANGPWFREHQSRGKKKKKGGRAFPLVLLSAFDPISIFMPLSTLFNHLYIPIIKMLLLLMRTVVVSFKESLKMKAAHHHNNYRSVDAGDDVAGWWSTEGINRFVVVALLPNNINIRVIPKQTTFHNYLVSGRHWMG